MIFGQQARVTKVGVKLRLLRHPQVAQSQPHSGPHWSTTWPHLVPKPTQPSRQEQPL